MRLHLTPQSQIAGLNQQLSTLFPYLKLEFYTASGKKLSEEHRLGDGGKKMIAGSIEILPGDSVAAVENRFLKNHGLHVQVLRRSGGLWLRTGSTDQYEMQKQNDLGEAASRPMRLNWNTLFL